MDGDLSSTRRVASGHERLDQHGPPDGASWRESPRDDLVHGRQRKRDPWSDTPPEVQQEPVLPQDPGLEGVLGRQEMALGHPGQSPSCTVAIQADLRREADFLQQIVDLVPGPKITPLRGLDIIAWQAGRSLQPEDPSPTPEAP